MIFLAFIFYFYFLYVYSLIKRESSNEMMNTHIFCPSTRACAYQQWLSC